MEQNNKLKLFISYSHKDNNSENPYIDQFKTHIALLKNNGLIKEWYDREILGGEDYQHKIDNNLEDADIICIFISANFLSSGSCIGEKKKALELRNKNGIPIVPIILSPCGWRDDKDICDILALPTDGDPISLFTDRDNAWNDVYKNLKKIIEKEMLIKQLKIKEEFDDFLHDTEMLTKAHPQKESVLLDDIFVCTELSKYDNLKEFEDEISSDELSMNLLKNDKIIIAGEDQSGKTTLCKRMFCELRNLNFIPVYVSDKKTHFRGKIKKNILKSLREQYKDIDVDVIDQERIIPIIDDFHHAKDKEKHINELSKYPHCIVIVDDIFGLNIKDETMISSFTTFRIKELKPSIRYELIKKWEHLTDKGIVDDYKNIDKKIELINSTLGKNVGKGIMPAYPFFILSTIVAYEIFSISLDQEITSQGYCYQALIYYYLRKRGVKNDDVDIYINFLTELASYIHKEKKVELNSSNFNLFMESYLETYNLPIKPDILLENLSEIVSEDCFKNYSFRYPYFYYFFVAKYLSEHMENSKAMGVISNIINNLHVDENAYIAVFLTHHSKNNNIIKEIESVASCLFNEYDPATLTKDEMKFFDEQAHIIVKAALPPANTTPEMERTERLNVQDEIEQSYVDVVEKEHIDKDESIEKELRRAIKTVEVMGCIIRNRAGSLEKVRLENIFMEAMNVHLRILSNLFEMIKSENDQKEIVDFILERLSHLEDDQGINKILTGEEKRKLAKSIFWNMNYFTVFGIIYKIVHSLGSDKLTVIMNNVCDEVDTPASFLVKHGILMEYTKNLQIKELKAGINEDDFSEIAERATKLMIVNHCSINPIDYKGRQQLKSMLQIPTQKLLPRSQNDYK